MNKNHEDPECDGSISFPKPLLRDRLLWIAAKGERVLVRMGKIGLVLTVLITAAVAVGQVDEVENLNHQVDVFGKIVTSPDRSWVAKELVVKGGPGDFPGRSVLTGRFVCGRAGQVPKECIPDPYVARTAELCVFPRTVDHGKFGTPQLCPDSILHPPK